MEVSNLILEARTTRIVLNLLRRNKYTLNDGKNVAFRK